MRRAHRLQGLQPYLFAELDKKIRALRQKGVDVINLGVGDPDMPTPAHIVERLREEVYDAGHHRYPDYEGSPELRRAVADWYRKRFGVQLDPDKEVMVLIGSKEGIAHILWAFVDAGDYALIPDPAYPVYRTHTILAGGIPHSMPLREERSFLPDLASIPGDVAERAKIMFLNYPNNPTGAVANVGFFAEAVAFARKHGVLLCHDSAYCEITYDGHVAPSVLEVDGAKDVCLEFGSFSKPFNMTGWRLGYAVGNAEAVAALGVIKTNTDSGQFTAVQHAGVEALAHEPGRFIREVQAVYAGRREVVAKALRALGWEFTLPGGAFYVWVRVPEGTDSTAFVARMLDRTGVLVTPGVAFGEAGEGYCRISLTVPDERLAEALGRIQTRMGK